MIADSAVPGQLVFYALSTLLALLVAKASWELYEKHFLKLKRYFPSSSSGVITLPSGQPRTGEGSS